MFFELKVDLLVNFIPWVSDSTKNNCTVNKFPYGDLYEADTWSSWLFLTSWVVLNIWSIAELMLISLLIALFSPCFSDNWNLFVALLFLFSLLVFLCDSKVSKVYLEEAVFVFLVFDETFLNCFLAIGLIVKILNRARKYKKANLVQIWCRN